MTTSRFVLTIAAALGLIVQAAAHNVPVNPTTCRFDTFEVTTALGAAQVAPATDADSVRIVYSAGTKTAQIQAGATSPRAFSVGGVSGDVRFPMVFSSILTTGGDLTFDSVPLAVDVGGTAVTAPVTLTTGLLVAGDGFVQGEPIGSDG